PVRRFIPQCLQITAASWISSAQKGHFFVCMTSPCCRRSLVTATSIRSTSVEDKPCLAQLVGLEKGWESAAPSMLSTWCAFSVKYNQNSEASTEGSASVPL